MQRKIVYSVNKEYSGKTVERFLRDKGYTRQSLVDLKKMDENLLIDGKWVYLNHLLNTNDELIVQIEERGFSEKILPADLHFDIAYEDEDILVVDKPYDMPIHPSINNYDNTYTLYLTGSLPQILSDTIYSVVVRIQDSTGMKEATYSILSQWWSELLFGLNIIKM